MFHCPEFRIQVYKEHIHRQIKKSEILNEDTEIGCPYGESS